MQRYNSSLYIYDLEIYEAFELLKLGFKQKQKEYMFQEWLNDKNSLKDDYKYNFELYYEKRTQPPKLDKDKVKKSKERIDKQVKRFREKHDRK